VTKTEKGNPAIKVRLEPGILAQLRQKAHLQERGRGGVIAYYLRSLAYRDLGLPEPAPWAATDSMNLSTPEGGSGVHSPNTLPLIHVARPEPCASACPVGAFLEALYAAYQLKSGKPHGSLEKFRDLYQVLTLLPQARHLYTLEQFAQDIYRLDREPRTITQSGVPYRLHPGSTGARKRSNLLIVQSIHGAELRYYGIEFFRC
jgi:hypothetical protein